MSIGCHSRYPLVFGISRNNAESIVRLQGDFLVPLMILNALSTVRLTGRSSESGEEALLRLPGKVYRYLKSLIHVKSFTQQIINSSSSISFHSNLRLEFHIFSLLTQRCISQL